MKILALDIYGFRGVEEAHLVFPEQVALVGPNGVGKSTIIDALCLVFGRQKLVRELTEHDFSGSSPEPADRIRLVATLGGFPGNEPERSPHWFRHAVHKWWDAGARRVSPVEVKDGELAVQVGYAARFDHEDLEVKARRYFHDDDEHADPFDEDHVQRFPDRLLRDIGFFVLPAHRTWAATLSFGSELFRKAVATVGGIPASSVLAHLRELRSPQPALEDDPDLQPLVTRINERLGQLIPGRPSFQLRVTSTDSYSFLRALVPHYQRMGGTSLPAARHGTGLISLQTLALLLEIGRVRRERNESFILALEEPELHVPPGLQRRLIGDAAAASDQVICTTHAPRVAAFFDAASIQLLARTGPGTTPCRVEGRPLAPTPMVNVPNALVQLYSEQRTRLVEALMCPAVLVPEGRVDFEWLRLLLDATETGRQSRDPKPTDHPPFAAVVGVVPTANAQIEITHKRLRELHDTVFVLVDGDDAGGSYAKALLKCALPPAAIVQWPREWTIENVICWVVEADEESLLPEIGKRLDLSIPKTDDLERLLKEQLKQHYMAHDEIAGAVKHSVSAVQRAGQVLDALARVASGKGDDHPQLAKDTARSLDVCPVYRFAP